MITVDELLPVSITVTPDGVAEDYLLRELELTRSQVHALHSETIGAPRHYRYRHGIYFYTADGIRAVAEHFGKRVDIQTAAEVAAARPSPVMWWQKDNA